MTRTGLILEEAYREPVATNFKFFLPFPKSRTLTPEDMPEVTRYLGAYFETFKDEEQARVFAAGMLIGFDQVLEGEGGDVQAGMTPLKVIEILGMPEKEEAFEARVRWIYSGLTVIFENGRVKKALF